MLSIHARKVNTGQALLQRDRLQERKLKRKKRTSLFETIFNRRSQNARAIGVLGACLQYTGKYDAYNVLRRKCTTRGHHFSTARTKGAKGEIHDTINNSQQTVSGDILMFSIHAHKVYTCHAVSSRTATTLDHLHSQSSEQKKEEIHQTIVQQTISKARGIG